MEGANGTSHSFLSEASAKYLPVVCVSFLIFSVLIYFASPRLSAKYVPVYNKLSAYEQGDWNTRVVSMIHAMLVSVLGIYILIKDDDIEKDKVWGTSDLSRINVCIISGYMVADAIAMFLWFPLRESWIYFLHHFAVLYPFLNNVVFGVLTYFANFRIITECSTVFVNNRWLLSTTGKKASTWYKVNGIVMVVVFFLCRIAFVLPYYAITYQIIDQAIADIPKVLILAWLPCGLLMDLLNLYWFQIMFKGAVKMMFPEKKLNGVTVRNRVKGE